MKSEIDRDLMIMAARKGIELLQSLIRVDDVNHDTPQHVEKLLQQFAEIEAALVPLSLEIELKKEGLNKLRGNFAIATSEVQKKTLNVRALDEFYVDLKIYFNDIIHGTKRGEKTIEEIRAAVRKVLAIG